MLAIRESYLNLIWHPVSMLLPSNIQARLRSLYPLVATSLAQKTEHRPLSMASR
jgi:hypothetical protein